MQIPKTIYFNVEQPASPGGGDLSQERIDRVFKGRCRVTTNFITFRNLKIYKLNGANTERLGVVPIQTSEGENIHATNVERTLIDAVVRPIYAGGIAEVGEAFKAAAGRVSVKRIASYLRKLNYTYPYHQAIGFYLERAGDYKEAEIALMRKFPMEFDFYLNYQIKNPVHNEKWRLWVPQRF
jgi:predicted transcriptional regulator of viral defense system